MPFKVPCCELTDGFWDAYSALLYRLSAGRPHNFFAIASPPSSCVLAEFTLVSICTMQQPEKHAAPRFLLACVSACHFFLESLVVRNLTFTAANYDINFDQLSEGEEEDQFTGF